MSELHTISKNLISLLVRIGIRTCLLVVLVVAFSYLLRGGKALSGRNDFDHRTNENEVVGNIDPRNLRPTISYLQSLGNRSSWEKQEEAAAWVLNQFKKFGLDVAFHNYESNKRTWRNVIANIRGKKRAKEIILLMAHLDSRSDSLHDAAPGADDNATGVAVLLETARILRSIPTDRTVTFCVFTNEERGPLGSKAFAHWAKQQKLNIQAGVNLDVLAYNSPKRPFYWSAVLAHSSWVKKAKSILKMARNDFVGLINGKDVIKVVGRVPNRKLVKVISQTMRISGLKVKELVGNDCG